MAGVRHVPVVFFQRRHAGGDKFHIRQQLSGKEGCVPGEPAAHDTDIVGIIDKHVFCGRAVPDVCFVWLYAEHIQSAGILLSFWQHLPCLRAFAGDKLSGSIHEGCGAACRHDDTVWLLGYADFLELEADTGEFSVGI